MLRYQTALASVLGSVLVVATLGDGEIRSLADALAATTRAIDVLHGIQTRLEQDPAGALGLVLSATEPPILDERARDERMEALRDEVNLLQMELDASDSPFALPAPPPMAGDPAPRVHGVPAGSLTTGLDDSLRRLLEPDRSRPAQRGTEPRHAEPAGETRPVSPEGEGYSADPLRHAIACYRAGRFDDALLLLGPDEKDLEALYWRARTLEKLGRLDEALETLGRVVGRADAYADKSTLERAKTELEFLEWKRDFLARQAQAEEAAR